MRKHWICIAVFLLLCKLLLAQPDHVGSGQAIQFDGVNDYVTYGDIYHDLNLPFTVSAWVYLDPSSGAAPIFTTNDNPTIYRGFWFFINPTAIWCEFGDGKGGSTPAFRRGKLANIPNITGRWAHVCVVMTAPFDIKIYVNGQNVGGDTRGESNSPMASSIPGDIAKTAYFTANGGVQYWYKGLIDEVRLWNRSLTETEVRQTMCKKLVGDEPGLIGNWTFDETSGSSVYDKSPNQFHGALVGNPQRVFSGAPIGDASTFTYQSNWTGVSLSLSGGGNTLTTSAITGSPWGAHIYRVDTYPSQSNGLSQPDVLLPYFGVFLASSGASGGFSTSINQVSNCPLYVRSDNSVATWVDGTSPFSYRKEIILMASGAPFVANLGTDAILCDVTAKLLSPVSDPNNKTFLWSTGATSPTIQVTTSGTYWVNVTQSCQTDRDTVQLALLKTPADIDLGSDRLICDEPSVTLSVVNLNGDNIKWNTGSDQQIIQVTESGEFWVEIENACGISRDTVSLTVLMTPSPINLGDDILTCNILDLDLNVAVASVDEVEWSTGSNQPSIHISESGQYWIEVKNACGVARDTIILTSLLIEVDKIPNVITPNGDDKNEYFVVEKPIEGAYLAIYDRWGKQVYESTAYNNNWNGSGLSPGVYYWRAEGTCIKEAKGAISVVR